MSAQGVPISLLVYRPTAVQTLCPKDIERNKIPSMTNVKLLTVFDSIGVYVIGTLNAQKFSIPKFSIAI